ncbi:cache domain-containing protein [Desulfosarcina sp.]|uniref:sensor histidine kinase n=1 Tax=Desulfosarcina sp. TaxID=2027861 RepID=UPI0029BFB08D|nr:cache domain-containing protein [Desulfosarcina sp.]
MVADFPDFQQALVTDDRGYLLSQMEKLSDRIGLNFAGILDQEQRVASRIGIRGDETVPAKKINPLADLALTQGKTVWGTIILDPETLQDENSELVEQAVIPKTKVAWAEAGLESELTSGLAIGAAVPVKLDGRVIGTIYGGVLLNRDTSIVDKIGETVFKNEVYKGRNVGTSTIFLGSLRISTNVMDQDGRRALGTSASEDVSLHVLGEGKRWTKRARVLSDWYITAYEPITDIFEQRVGMLYVGALEAKYLDVRKRAIIVFALITLGGVMSAFVLGWFLTGIIMRPLNRLIRASVEISKGNFSPDIKPISKSDMGILQREFLNMINALIEREKRQKEESEICLIQSEKQASVGKLAAGVAHEINNPLTAVLTFTHLILRRDDLVEEVRADLEMIATQTERVRKIVKSLLDFSRQSRLNPEPLDLNRQIEKSIKLLMNHALIKGVDLKFTSASGLPMFTLDRSQCQSVWINMIINALDVTEPGDEIEVSTRQVEVEGKDGAEIIIRDTGSGILPEDMDKLFDPFFTTKEVGKGTGLGLAVSAGIIERHGGTVKVASTLGEGTRFTIWMPATPLSEAPAPPQPDNRGIS